MIQPTRQAYVQAAPMSGKDDNVAFLIPFLLANVAADACSFRTVIAGLALIDVSGNEEFLKG